MQLSNEAAQNLVMEGVTALREGRSADARERFDTVTRTGRANAQIWLLLATACRGENDSSGEEAAVDSLLSLEPRVVRGHIMKADCRAKAGDDAAALGFYKSAMLIASGQSLPDELRGEVGRAEAAAAQIEERLGKRREDALAARGFPPDRRSPRFQRSLEILSGGKQIFVQEPTGYYFPELPQIQFYDTLAFSWVPAVEAAAGAIRDELAGVLATGMEGFRPYIQTDPNRPRLDDNQLLDNGDWSALFLCENGRRNDEAIVRCPATWAAMQAAPLLDMPNSPTLMFSLLRPGARIAPHTGMHNTRLVCHLPLVVPPNCGFRVGNEPRQWEEGRLLIFDDTIEHEAWNDSTQNRVVLIFDIWRPELSERERQEVAALFAGPAL